MKYYVTIEETVSDVFEVYADNMEDAINTAQKKYCDGEIVLTPGELIHKQISAYDESYTQQSEWMEF